MTLQELYDAASKDLNSGEYEGAIQKLESILTHAIGDDNKAKIASLLGSVYLITGNNESGVQRLLQALAITPNNPADWSNLSEGWRRLNQLNKAVEAARKALTLRQDFPEAHNQLGNALKAEGKLDEAITSYKQTLNLNPNHAEAYNNLGVTLQGLGRYHEAEVNYLKAMDLKPNDAEFHSNLGVTLNALGRLNEAVANFRQAIAIKPGYAEAHNNLGITLQELFNFKEAKKLYQKALTLKPDYAQAHYNLGNVLQANGELIEAIRAYHKALFLAPDNDNIYYSIGNCLTGITFSTYDNSLSNIINTTLEKNNFVRPKNIAASAISLIKQHPTIKNLLETSFDFFSPHSLQKVIISLSNIPLLINLMNSCPLPDLGIEFLLKNIRSSILLNLDVLDNDNTILPFQISLSMQCFLNEYIYESTEVEQCQLLKLENDVQRDVQNELDITSNKLACLASYKSLLVYPWTSNILNQKEIEPLTLVHIIEPSKEKTLARQIPHFKLITNKISSKVREQYETNPYPRWKSLKLYKTPQSIHNITKSFNIKIKNTNIYKVKTPKLLIAGCGTGQHAIGSASRYEKCDVLAIDLSLNSLAFAKRKTIEMNIKNIKYMQADILNITDLNQKFDIIESVGVLHHMEDPLAGLNELVACLNTGGIIKIGVYSELARMDIIKFKDEVQKDDIKNETDIINFFRSKIINSKEEHHRNIRLSNDFYSRSSIQDLLFHVKEHHFTIPKIKSYLAKLDLHFGGFEHPKLSQFISHSTILSKDNIHCLDAWEKFEMKNPKTFAGMYQFWCQKL